MLPCQDEQVIIRGGERSQDNGRISFLLAVGGGKMVQTGDVLRERYEIQELMNSVRDKQVYLAYDRVLDCRVTVDAFSNNSIMPGGLTLSAWEARVLGRLGDHPNIATVLDHWEDDEMAVMVTRHMPGGNLRDLIARSQEPGGGLPIKSILRISAEIAQALSLIFNLCGFGAVRG